MTLKKTFLGEEKKGISHLQTAETSLEQRGCMGRHVGRGGGGGPSETSSRCHFSGTQDGTVV